MQKQAQALRIARTSIRHIISREFEFHHFKLSIVQQLKPTDYHQRLEFSVNMLSLFEVNDDTLLLMSYEAHFHLDVPLRSSDLTVCDFFPLEKSQVTNLRIET